MTVLPGTRGKGGEWKLSKKKKKDDAYVMWSDRDRWKEDGMRQHAGTRFTSRFSNFPQAWVLLLLRRRQQANKKEETLTQSILKIFMSSTQVSLRTVPMNSFKLIFRWNMNAYITASQLSDVRWSTRFMTIRWAQKKSLYDVIFGYIDNRFLLRKRCGDTDEGANLRQRARWMRASH